MADAQAQRLQQIASALDSFSQQDLPLAAASLLKTLGYSSDKTIDLGSRPADFVAKLRQFSQTPSAFDGARAKVAQWRSAHFLFQLTNDEIPSLMLGQRTRESRSEAVTLRVSNTVCVPTPSGACARAFTYG